jgi:uracil-DNA glycosylase
MDVKPKDQLLFEKLGSKWFDLLHEQFELKYFKDLRTILAQEYSTQTIYPNSKDIFKAFKLCIPSNVKVIFVGQDPYANEHANGLCFGSKLSDEPKSLSLIFDSIEKTYGERPKDITLEYLTKQGVLLLNTSLTVRKYLPLSHSQIGWEEFITEAIKKASDNTIPVVTFGRYATNLVNNAKLKLIQPKLYLEHPSFAARENREWESKNVFKTVNDILEGYRKSKINWITNE